MKSVPASLLLAMLCALLVVSGGCGLLGAGSDDSRLTIKNKGCEVDVSQHGKVAGQAGTAFSEDIQIGSDCTVTIVVKDNVNQSEEEKEAAKTPAEAAETEEGTQ